MLEVHISKHSPFRLKITVGCPRCCGVCVVCCVGVGVDVWKWCCVLCGGVCFCVFCVVLLFSLNSLLSLSCSLSLSLFPSSLSFFLLSSFALLSSLLATKHCGKNRSTNTAANFEALRQVHSSRFSPSSSPLPPPFSPSHTQKKKE